jgi:hypothetical protein
MAKARNKAVALKPFRRCVLMMFVLRLVTRIKILNPEVLDVRSLLGFRRNVNDYCFGVVVHFEFKEHFLCVTLRLNFANFAVLRLICTAEYAKVSQRAAKD